MPAKSKRKGCAERNYHFKPNLSKTSYGSQFYEILTDVHRKERRLKERVNITMKINRAYRVFETYVDHYRAAIETLNQDDMKQNYQMMMQNSNDRKYTKQNHKISATYAALLADEPKYKLEDVLDCGLGGFLNTNREKYINVTYKVWHQQAKQSMLKKNYDQAIIYLNEAYKSNNRSGEKIENERQILDDRAQCYLLLGCLTLSFRDADAIMSTGSTGNYFFTRAMMIKAEVLFQLGKFEWAAIWYHRYGRFETEGVEVERIEESEENSENGDDHEELPIQNEEIPEQKKERTNLGKDKLRLNRLNEPKREKRIYRICRGLDSDDGSAVKHQHDENNCKQSSILNQQRAQKGIDKCTIAIDKMLDSNHFKDEDNNYKNFLGETLSEIKFYQPQLFNEIKQTLEGQKVVDIGNKSAHQQDRKDYTHNDYRSAVDGLVRGGLSKDRIFLEMIENKICKKNNTISPTFCEKVVSQGITYINKREIFWKNFDPSYNDERSA